MVYHGDRAVAACDGGFSGMQLSSYGHRGRGLCKCPGWKAGESLSWLEVTE